VKKVISVLLLLCAVFACSRTGEDNYFALREKNIRCPDGAMLEYSTWGTHGKIAKCVILHGPYAAAKNGKVVIEGEYNMGKISRESEWLE
jgi:hypothetical protein